jgi:autophagy-related protein 11
MAAWQLRPPPQVDLTVVVAHSGREIGYSGLNTVEALRSDIERQADIPSTRQILMHSRGRKVKSPLQDRSLVYVFDRAAKEPTASLEDGSADLPLPQPPPSPTSDATIEEIKEVARKNLEWALQARKVLEDADNRCTVRHSEALHISNSISTALESVRTPLQTLNQNFENTQKWAVETSEELRHALANWERSYSTLRELPVREEVGVMLRAPHERPVAISTLADLLDVDAVREDAASIREAAHMFEKRLEGLQRGLSLLNRDAEAVQVTRIPSMDGSDGLLSEADIIIARLKSDYDGHSLEHGTGCLKKALSAFARDYRPAMEALIQADQRQSEAEVNNAYRAIRKDYYNAMKAITQVQGRLAGLQADVAHFDVDARPDEIYRVFQLPTIYGCTLIEAVRRSEWTSKMQSEIDALHNDLSENIEDEQRRRKRWRSSYGKHLNEELNVQDALIDIRASKPRNAWPFVEREEINAYIEDLRALAIDDAIEEVLNRLEDLDRPVRRPRPSPFKSGSVHDPVASSTMDDTHRLNEEKLKLEEKVRASESRVRKLEDLLHRQSQLQQPSSGGFFSGGPSEHDRYASSPSPFQKQSEFPHRPSIPLRRTSNAQEERLSVQKISALEAQVQKLQDEAHEERRSSTESRDKMQEAESVKHDLMANFEAQRQEFDEERQLMDDENHKLKIRIEELEDELDRILGSRDHLKQTNEQKFNELKAELDNVREEQRREDQESKLRTENLEKDIFVERERTANMERQLHDCRDERNVARDRSMELARQLRTREEQQQDWISSLQNTHSNLSPAGSAPDDLGRLVGALEILSEGAAIHARGLDDNLQLATAEGKALEEKSTHAEKMVQELRARLTTAEAETGSLRQTVEHERSKLKAAREEVDDAHGELDAIRSKLAAGETGSDALRQRLNEEEQKVSMLQGLKHDNESTIQSLRQETGSLELDNKATAERLEILKRKLDARGDKARELSERLHQHNDRVIRMLEQFGFSVSRQDDTLLIQRASKVSASTTLSGNEGSTPMKRTISGTVPAAHYSDPTDLDNLYWTSDNETTDEEIKYRNFMTALQRLDLDSTIDVVAKRYKDVENLAKKYQKDSRAYRDKAHRLQSDAHDKIAYRSFKDGDLALFLPTRNQATRPWAAFNVGAPHYFLREQDHHKLQSRDWLLARISKVEERVVDLSRSLSSTRGGASINAEAGDSASARSIDDENPFELSDGLRWYMIDAAEEKPGAPGTPSVGKSTVIASNVEAEALMGRKDKPIGKSVNAAQVAKTLNKSLESRRSSSASKRSASIKKDSASLKDAPPPAPLTSATTTAGQSEPIVKPGDSYTQPAREDARVFDIVRQDLLQGP